MVTITYTLGDATLLQEGEGIKILCHVCNDIGYWGKGFVLAISKRWSEPENHYKAQESYKLGTTEIIKVADNIYVANMIAQQGVNSWRRKKKCRISYDHLRQCLNAVNDFAVTNNATLHMPRIGCGLALGDWNIIQRILLDTVTVPITVYTLK